MILLSEFKILMGMAVCTLNSLEIIKVYQPAVAGRETLLMSSELQSIGTDTIYTRKLRKGQMNRMLLEMNGKLTVWKSKLLY